MYAERGHYACDVREGMSHAVDFQKGSVLLVANLRQESRVWCKTFIFLFP